MNTDAQKYMNVDEDMICNESLIDGERKEFVSSQEGVEDNPEQLLSGDGGKLHIIDSDEYVDSQESVDFAARVGIMISDKDKYHDDEERIWLHLIRKLKMHLWIKVSLYLLSLMMIMYPYFIWLVFWVCLWDV
ncbi:hypothetical protein GUJ93_ZPchr0009g1708 [Zizania palustris]|uniref:Uncharacterized protein n=1 Tax=Zizania palustris TaxID=103762 RepID=A0A8J5VKG5_ZIZPA|nr:hypothetical protein GUJ93_ZPchr0009g1708 [Zizania palustris]